MDIHFTGVSDIIKTFIKNHNKDNPRKQYIRCSGLSLNKDNSEPVLIAQLQIEDNIIAKVPNGTYSQQAQLYNSKVEYFLNKSIDDKASLVLTPEYSVPYSLIDKFTDDISRLRLGTLYCLSAQGLDTSNALEYIEKIDKKRTAMCIGRR